MYRLTWFQLNWKAVVAAVAVAAGGLWWWFQGPRYVGAKPEPGIRMVVLLHGHGADKDDLVPVAQQLASGNPRLGFLLPDGPYRAGLGGRTWYRYLRASSRQKLQEKDAEQRRTTRDAVHAWVALLEGRGVVRKDIYLGGFSSGAVAATDAILDARGAGLGGLIAMSGGGMSLNLEPLAERPKLRAFVSHGETDSVVDSGESKALAEALRRHGHAVTATWVSGGHDIPPQVRLPLRVFLEEGL